MQPPRELIEAFAEAVPFALREMAGVEAVPGAAGPAGDLSATVRLTAAAGESRLVLGFPWPTAEALARRVFAGVVLEVTADLVRDCTGEVANVVAGQAKVLLVGKPAHFTLSTPVVQDGPGGEGGHSTWFESDVGAFRVTLG